MAADIKRREDNTLTFYEYLVEQAVDPEDSPAGDFAVDAEADCFFPRDIKADADGFASVFKHLYFYHGAIGNVLEAFIEAWEAFYMVATGEKWWGA